ncbi:DUF4858 domain-containing protein [Bacteroides bouchesdurhonensis]|uniref:DUF4858 domain-containing protein n=1 Tax=Bacteroides bouchesdurhonensis TaxID=1841855 RepID=UPI0022E12403|nr:DUF4858 domain-containing protein [Bacteroides bouchesdurhonensis]
MERLIKRFVTVMALSLTTLLMYAQEWTSKDSLHVKKLLDGEQELILNPDAVKSIDFGNAAGTPRISKEKSWMHFDESLPQVLPKPKVVLTLSPYTATTPYDWDPVYQKKIRVTKNTWRGDPFYELRQLLYTKSSNISLGKGGVYISGGAIGGLDLMAMFTRDFWSKKRLETRDRTLEVLRTYGDSTNVMINVPIEQIAR